MGSSDMGVRLNIRRRQGYGGTGLLGLNRAGQSPARAELHAVFQRRDHGPRPNDRAAQATGDDHGFHRFHGWEEPILSV